VHSQNSRFPTRIHIQDGLLRLHAEDKSEQYMECQDIVQRVPCYCPMEKPGRTCSDVG